MFTIFGSNPNNDWIYKKAFKTQEDINKMVSWRYLLFNNESTPYFRYIYGE